jgi:hypothetical protein
MTKTIFLDEAGYTGDNLTNDEQPAFVVASHQITEADSRALLDAHFPKNKAAELKHTNVRKYAGSQRGMVNLVKTIRLEKRPIAIYAVHKRFALFQRFFDYFIEPVMHGAGIDAYDRSFNIRATDVAFAALPPILGRQFMPRLLDLFETAARERSSVHMAQLWMHLENARKLRPGSHIQMLDLLLAAKSTSRRRLGQLPNNALDVSLSVLVALIVHWRRLSNGPFEVIHDQSTNLAKHRPVWDWLSSPEQQEVTLGVGDYRDALLPLNVTRTEFAKSHNYAGLQLADLLAGGNMEICRFILGDQSNMNYAKALTAAGLNEVTNNIWPNPAWKPPQDQGDPMAIDPLNFLAAAPFSKKP